MLALKVVYCVLIFCLCKFELFYYVFCAYLCIRIHPKTLFMRILKLLFFMCCLSVTVVSAQPSQPRTHNIGVGVNHHTSDGSLFSYSNVALLGSVDTLHGVQTGLLAGAVRHEMRGVNIGGLAAVSRGNTYGVTIGGIMTAIDGQLRGVQLAGVSNITHSGNGLQIAGLTNASTTPFRGVQFSGITNVSMGVKRGVQLAGAANVCSSSMRGVQMAMYNYADTLSGSQFGFVNVCVNHPRGVQVGIINYSRDTVAHKIGLVNVNPKTRIDLMLFGGSSTKANIAFRFRNRSTYNIIGVGTHFLGLDERFSGAVFYRIGQYFALSPRWSVSGDVGYYHVETFVEHSSEKPERLFSVQVHLNADYQMGRYVSAFASVGYGDTRYYSDGHRYRNRMIGEAGLAFRLVRTNRP